MKQRELLPMYGRCVRGPIKFDRKGQMGGFLISNNIYFDINGNPVADEELVVSDVYDINTRCRMDICCNLFDEETAREAIEKYISMEYSDGKIIEMDDIKVYLFHADSPSQFNIIEASADIENKKIYRHSYKVVDNSFEESAYALDFPNSCDIEQNWILEALRDTFENLGYIKSQPENDVTLNFTCLDSRIIKLDDIQGYDEGESVLACHWCLSNFYSAADNESVNEFDLVWDCDENLLEHYRNHINMALMKLKR